MSDTSNGSSDAELRLHIMPDGSTEFLPMGEGGMEGCICIGDVCYILPSDEPDFDYNAHPQDSDEYVCFGRRWIKREGTDPRLLNYIDTHREFFEGKPTSSEENDFEDRMNQAVQMFGPGLVTNEIGKLIRMYDSFGGVAE